jgi:hypothetical protein
MTWSFIVAVTLDASGALTTIVLLGVPTMTSGEVPPPDARRVRASSCSQRGE